MFLELVQRKNIHLETLFIDKERNMLTLSRWGKDNCEKGYRHTSPCLQKSVSVTVEWRESMENTLQTVAELMEIAAITAPKGAGKNFVVTKS